MMITKRIALIAGFLVLVSSPLSANTDVRIQTHQLERPLTFVIAQDTIRPEISSWGLEGDPASGDSFEAWANVSDSQSGIQNVSLVILMDRTESSKHLLDSNGTLFVNTIPGLPANHTFRLFIEAFDLANNSATSYSRTISTFPPTTTTSIDPTKSMPFVVSSSLVVMTVALLLSFMYERKRAKASN